MFGKITKICRHSFNQKVHVIAFVHWFGDTQYYQASGLYSVNTDTTISFHRAVPVTTTCSCNSYIYTKPTLDFELSKISNKS